MKHTYHDKHSREILAGMTIRHDNGDTEKVYATTGAFGADALGGVASYPASAARHADGDIEYYSLSNFRTSEWEIVE